MFIGRDNELKFLEDKYNERGGQLLVVYGRRRVGKTETLREFCKDKEHFFFVCTQSSDKNQLQKFSRQLLSYDIPAANYLSEFADWESAFSALLELPFRGERRVVVIDEFPYMCKAEPSIPSILQNLWDEKLKDSNIMLILCGSAMSFIEKDLLAEKNPLYGRATGIYKMKEMGFYDAAKFFPGYSEQDKLLCYAVLGGIPHYLKQFDPRLTVGENIKKHILTKGSALYSEVEFLLHQELRETPIYNSLIEAVALGSTTLNEISQKSLICDTSKTSVYLKNLIEIGIIIKEFSVDARIKERANSNRGLYRLADNFFRFWYAFCFTNYSQLEDGDVEGVYEYSVEPELHEFASLPFENVCAQYVKELQKNKKLPFRYTSIGRWFGKTRVRDGNKDKGYTVAETEIDILALSEKTGEYLLCECKFKNNGFSYSEYLDSKMKLSEINNGDNFYYALFSKNGFDSKIEKEREAGRLYLFELSDVVNCKMQ